MTAPADRPAARLTEDKVLAALDHYDECRALLDDALRVCGPDSGEYLRAEQARRIALVLLDAALATGGPRAAEASEQATA